MSPFVPLFVCPHYEQVPAFRLANAGARHEIPADSFHEKDDMSGIRLEEEFFEFLAQGRFMLQRSRGSGEHVFFPRVAAPRTGSRDLEWVEASGRGTVYATTVVRVKPPQPSYNVALVELEEGPRLMSRVEGIAPDAVRIGMPVRARIAQADGKPLLVFDAAQEAAR
jgi:uncharacterized OB-fold protein